MGNKRKYAEKDKKKGGTVRSGHGDDMLAKSTQVGFGLAKTNPPNRQDT